MIQTPSYAVTPRSRTIELADNDPIDDEVVEAHPKKPQQAKKQPLLQAFVSTPKPLPSDRFFRGDGTYILAWQIKKKFITKR